MPTFAGWEWIDRQDIDANPSYCEGIGDRAIASRWESSGFRETNIHETELWSEAYPEDNIEEHLNQWALDADDSFEGQSNLHGMVSAAFQRRIRRIDAGWPFLALHGSISQHPSLSTRRVDACIEVHRPWQRTYASALPLAPNWAGFLANTIVYSLLLGAFWLAAARLRLRREAVDAVRVHRHLLLKQSVISASVCLLLGGAATVLVAWAIAWFTAPVKRGAWAYEVQRRTGGEIWSGYRCEVPGDVLVRTYRYRDDSLNDLLTEPPPEEIIPRWSLWGEGATIRASWFDAHLVEGMGWPLLALKCEYDPSATGGTTARARSGIETSAFRMTDVNGVRYMKTLPVLPIWVGFVGNTVFYATVWFALTLGFRLARGSVRHRRGRCLSCGYDLRGDFDAGCPECGWGRG